MSQSSFFSVFVRKDINLSNYIIFSFACLYYSQEYSGRLCKISFLKLSLFVTFLWGIYKILDQECGLKQKRYWRVEGLYRGI